MVPDDSLLNTQHYKVRMKELRFSLNIGVVAIEKGTFGLPLSRALAFVGVFLFIIISMINFVLIIIWYYYF